MTSKLWQQPYVNIFKHCQISEWKKCSKEGDVSTIMDKTLKCTVYRVSGSVPAGNYIQFPKTSSQSLGLTGHCMYILFKPIATKYFVVHSDVATHDGIIVRISFSNLFKEFKSTSTWLQFPFISNPVPGSVESVTSASLPLKAKVGNTPTTSRWTLLCIDLHYMLSVYLNRKYSYVKTIRLCANILIKNVFTSDTKYTPGISMKVARKTGLLETGFIPLPREMSFLAEDLEDWQRKYDYVTFPTDNGEKSLRDVIPGRAKSPGRTSRLATLSPIKSEENEAAAGFTEGKKYSAKLELSLGQRYAGNPVKSRVAMIDKILESQPSAKKIFSDQLPEVGLGQLDDENVQNESIHIYANKQNPHYEDYQMAKVQRGNVKREHGKEPKTVEFNSRSSVNFQCLQPDPILSLDKLIGIGGGTMKNLLWTKSSSHIVYPCHAVIVSMDAKTGKQSFLLGHNSKITALAFNGNSTLLASAQSGDDAIIRIWKYKSKRCLAVFQSCMNDPFCISFSQSGSKICAAGSSNHGKQVVAVWDASFIMTGHKVTLIAKALVDIHIAKIKICPFDDFKLVSCGKSNVRVWKLKTGSLRSLPIDFGEHQLQDFTDFDFECIQRLVQDSADRKIYSCTSSGALFVINFKTLSVVKVYNLLVDKSSTAAFTCLALNDAFCVTGSSDGYLRLWPLDFDGPFMEAEHEGAISAVAISSDGVLVSAIIESGNLGVLDLSTKSYKTLIRSHLKTITSISFDDIRNQIATVSKDRGIRIWHRSNMNQLYDFRAPGDTPCVVCFHPMKEVLVCGFENGCIRVFDVASTSLIVEHKNHRGKITGLLISSDGEHLHICDSKGSLALYDSRESYGLIRLLPNALAKLEEVSCSPIVLDDKGRRLACIGPSEFVITVFDARSLDELLRIDITSMASSKNDAKLDSARVLCYTPSIVGQLVAITSTSRMLKLEANTGQLISEVANIHRGLVTAICASPNGQYLATAGDKVIKIWDYHMRMDLNFQVFIGHSDPVTNLKFTSDGSQLYSAAECIFIWNFLGKSKNLDSQRFAQKSPKRMINFSQQNETERETLVSNMHRVTDNDEENVTHPRGTVPKPTKYEPLNLSMSPIPPEIPKKSTDESLDISSEASSESSLVDLGTKPLQKTPESKVKTQTVIIKDDEHEPIATSDSLVYHHAPPTVTAHFKIREKVSKLAEKRYSAPHDQAGLKLKSVVGYDGRGRNNVIWHPVTGLFAYACGCIVVMEDLTTGRQKLLRYHTEDISTLSAHNDGQVIASASAAGPSSARSQICIWEIRTGLCRKVIPHHKYVVVALQYSRDDRFLVSIGDYRECSVAVWSTIDYDLLVTSSTRYPIHSVRWDPFTMNEFASVGQNGSVLFWLLDETKQQVTLNVHEAEVPEDVFTDRHETTFDLTSLAYAGNSVLYVGASNGVVSAWDTRQNKCFMHWKSDSTEILQLIAGDGKLITGGASQNLCLWSVGGVANVRNAEDHENGLLGKNGLIMDDELQLDGCIVSAVFDSSLDLGVVGTNSGTIWYINWEERTSIRLISGHKEQVNSLIFGGNTGDLMASCASDGSMRLWNTDSYEQTLQFLVLNQRCNCVSFRPVPQAAPLHTFTQDGRHETTIHSSPAKNSRPSQCVAGYSDGTVRMFDLGLVEMILKLQPHPVSVTAITFSSDGRVIISGAEDGLIAISSPTTGMTVRMLSDHKGAPITDIHASFHKDHSYSLSSPTLWLAASADRRVSIWTADWSKDFCELVDWLSFPAPNFAPDGTIVKKSDKDYYKYFPPSLARFSPNDPDIIIYTGYGMKKQILYYSLSRKQVIKAISLTDWALTIDLSPKGNLIAIGCEDRLVKIVDYNEGTFQDFIGHSDAVRVTKFSPNAKYLFSAGFSDVIVWELSI